MASDKYSRGNNQPDKDLPEDRPMSEAVHSEATLEARTSSLNELMPDVDALVDAVENVGRYDVVGEQGRGGLGRVLVVRDRMLGRYIALKELVSRTPSGDNAGDTTDDNVKTEPAVLRFLREARVTAQLEHPSIVPIHDLGRRADGTLYYTMKLVRGQTLSKAISQAASLEERLALLPHFVDVCQAIAYSHSKGIIHRDIKPANIMIGSFGETIVIDWGLAKPARAVETGEDRSNTGSEFPRAPIDEAIPLTKYGLYMGTPHYTPPEQAQGNVDAIDERSDVYALGAVLYELLTGHRPFKDQTPPDVIREVLISEPAPVERIEPKAPAELVAICRRAMQKKPEGRYQTAQALAEEIERFKTGAYVSAYAYSSGERLRRLARKHRVALLATCFVFLVLVVSGVVSLSAILVEKARTERAYYYSSISLAKASLDNRRLEEARMALQDAAPAYRGVEWGLLHQLAHPELVELRGHTNEVDYAAFNADGSAVVSCGRDGRGIVWDARTGEKRCVFVDLDEVLHRVSWGTNDERIVTATNSEKISVWDAQDYRLLCELSGYAPKVSATGRFFAAATNEGQTATLYDVDSGQILKTLDGPSTYMIHIALSSDDTQVAAAINDGSAWVWEISSGEGWQISGAHQGSTRFVEFSPDNSVLVTTGTDNLARLWNLETRAELVKLEGHEAAVTGAAFDPTGQKVITCSVDQTVRVWDATSAQQLAVLDGFSLPLGFLNLCPDGTCFVTHSGPSGSVVAIWPVVALEKRNRLARHTGPVNSVAFSADGALFATAGGHWRYQDDDRVIVWDTLSHEVRNEIRTGRGPAYCVRFSPDGAHIAVGSHDGTASIYDTRTGTCLNTYSGHADKVWGLDISPDGRTLATASWDGTAILWDIASGERKALLDGGARRLDVVAFNPKGTLVATGGMIRKVLLWDAATGEAVGSLDLIGTYRVSGMAFSPDGKYLATGGEQGNFILWNLDTRQELRRFYGHTQIVYGLAFSPDGRRLITGGKDASIRIWDVQSGRQLLVLDQHKDCVSTLTMSRDGNFLLSGSYDKTAVLWPIAPWNASN